MPSASRTIRDVYSVTNIRNSILMYKKKVLLAILLLLAILFINSLAYFYPWSDRTMFNPVTIPNLSIPAQKTPRVVLCAVALLIIG